MTKTKINFLLKQLSCGLLVVALVLSYFPAVASAAQITGRKVTMGSSVINANTTYLFNFTLPSATIIKSMSFAGCTTPTGACTPAPGFANANTSTLTTQPTGLDGSGLNTGWAVSTGTVGELTIVLRLDISEGSFVTSKPKTSAIDSKN